MLKVYLFMVNNVINSRLVGFFVLWHTNFDGLFNALFLEENIRGIIQPIADGIRGGASFLTEGHLSESKCYNTTGVEICLLGCCN